MYTHIDCLNLTQCIGYNHIWTNLSCFASGCVRVPSACGSWIKQTTKVER